MPVRDATQRDRVVVADLLQRALVEERAAGSDMLPTGRSVQFALDYFNSYVVGSRFGVCLLWSPPGDDPSPRGFILAGERWESDGFDRDVGESAWVWNFYVEPQFRKTGAGMELAEAVIEWTAAAQFDTLAFHLPTGSGSIGLAARVGAVPRGVWYTVDLSAQSSGSGG